MAVLCSYYIFIYQANCLYLKILHIVTEENAVMAGVQRRLPQAELRPAATESEMVKLIQEWRQEVRDTFGISLDTVRIDSCVNGYGVCGCVCVYVCVCV